MTGISARPGLLLRSAARSMSRYWWLLIGFAVAYFAAFAVWPGMFFALGVNHYEAWFIDTFALLASSDAAARGLDPYVANPLDYFQRPHVYSHWWLRLHDLGLTRADARWLGLAVVGMFLVAALARLRPRNPRQLLWYAVILCSSPIVLGLDRANNDLLIFALLALLVPALRSTRRWVRLALPGAIVALAAGLKYYPAAALLILLAGDDRREMRWRMGVAVALVLAAGLNVAADLRAFGPLAPKPAGLLSFGAVAAFDELGWTGPWPKAICLLLALVVVVAAWRKRWLGIWQPTPTQESDWLHFLLGSVLLTGCFLTSMNFGYRWIFALWLAPILWTLPRDLATPPVVRRLATWTGWLLLVALWWDAVCCLALNGLIGVVSGPTIGKLASYCFLAEQPVAWALFAALLVFLTHFAQRQLRVFVKRG